MLSAWPTLRWVSLVASDKAPGFSSRVQAILEAQRAGTSLPLAQGGSAPSPAPAPQGKLKPKAIAVVEAPTPPAVLRAVESYTPELMVALIIAQPDYTHAQYAAHFGRTPSWFASVLASEKFQAALAERKDEIPDPAITASMDERFKALAMRSLFVIQSKLDKPDVSDMVVLEAAKIGVKALGLGNTVLALPAAPQETVGAEAVASRIMEAMASAKARSNATAVDVDAREVPSGS